MGLLSMRGISPKSSSSLSVDPRFFCRILVASCEYGLPCARKGTEMGKEDRPSAHSERKTTLSTHTKQRAGVAHLDGTSHMWKYHFVPMPPAVSVRKLTVQRHMAIERDAARDRRTKRMSK